MKIDITKKTQSIIAVNKKTGEEKSVNLLHVGKREFYSRSKAWGIRDPWHKYSKQADWNIYIDV